MVVTSFKCMHQAFIAAWVALAVGVSAAPEARSQSIPGTIADQESIFIDGQTFRVVPGRPRPDSLGAMRGLGGRELGAGAIIYRSGDRLYILGAPLALDDSRPGGPDDLVVDADSEKLGRVRIEYEPPKNPEHMELLARLKQNQALETVQKI